MCWFVILLEGEVLGDDVDQPCLEPRKFLNSKPSPTMPLCRCPPWRTPALASNKFSTPLVQLLLQCPPTPTIRARSLRHYSSRKQHRHRQSFFEKLRDSWSETKIEWYSIPVGLGIGVVAFAHLRNMRKREGHGSGGDESGSRRKIRPMGSW